MKNDYPLLLFFFLLFSFCALFFSSPCEAKSKGVKITLFHLNDTYHIAPVQVKERDEENKKIFVRQGGMARIRTLVTTYKNNNPEIPLLILHAGDMLSPSLLSGKERLKGKQMIDVLNRVPLDIAVLGNHDFDFGCKGLEKRVEESKFIWLASNIKFPKDSPAFKKIKNIHIFEHQGIKIGFFGLTVPFRSAMPCHQYDKDKIIFLNPFNVAKQVMRTLKEKKVDIIVGITHLNMSIDEQIAMENPDIDLIIGGHEHVPLSASIGKTLIRKAGSNATKLGKVELTYFPPQQKSKPVIKKNREFISVAEDIQPDAGLKKIVDKYREKIKKYDKIIGQTKTPLEARSVCMRSHETNTGNMIADLMRKISKSDLALINGGTFRADKIFSTGLINATDIYNLIPYNDKIVSIEIDGKIILDALENGVANWGRLKGGFPQVSGIKFEFDPERPNYSKIIKNSVKINGKPLQLNKKYKLSANDFLVKRGEIDGYTMIQGKEVLGEHGLLTDVLIENIRSKKTISPITDKRIVIIGTDHLIHHKCGAPDQVF
tara:strand:- start:441 stop:2075 length:1635 start_codon:yes stop_codon:yes gene_type:complete